MKNRRVHGGRRSALRPPPAKASGPDRGPFSSRRPPGSGRGGWSRPLTPTVLAGVCRPSTQQLCRPPAEPPAAPGRLWVRLRRPEARPPVPFGDPRPPPQLRLDGPFSGLNDSHSLAFWTARACRLLGPRNYRLPERGAGCHPSPPGAGGLTSAPVARGPRRTSRLARRVPSRPSTGAARQAGRGSALPGPGFGGLTGTAAGSARLPERTGRGAREAPRFEGSPRAGACARRRPPRPRRGQQSRPPWVLRPRGGHAAETDANSSLQCGAGRPASHRSSSGSSSGGRRKAQRSNGVATITSGDVWMGAQAEPRHLGGAGQGLLCPSPSSSGLRARQRGHGKH